MTTGLRAAESLDPPHPYVDVQRQIKRAAKVGLATFKPPKKKSYRQVPLHLLVVHVLRWWKEVGWNQWVTRAPLEHGAVFQNAQGEFIRHSGAALFRSDLVSAGLQPTYEGHAQTFHA